MAGQTVKSGLAQRPADVVGPVSQTSTDSEVVLAGSDVDASLFGAVSYSFRETDGNNGVLVSVYRANQSDFSDEVQDGSDITVDASSNKNYVDAPSGFRFYRAKIQAQTAGSQGVIQATGFAH